MKNQKNFVNDLYNGRIESDSLFDFAENTDCIGDTVTSVLNILDSMTDLRTKTNDFHAKLGDYNKIGLSDKDSQVRASIKGFVLPVGVQFTPVDKFDKFSLHIEFQPTLDIHTDLMLHSS